MADICLIYSRRQKPTVRRLYDLLSQCHSVWWDDHIRAGDYRAEIERQLSLAKCVVPVWCGVSRRDADVLDEAKFAERRCIALLPVRIEDIEPPLGYGSLHTVDLIGWAGEPNHPGIQELTRNLEAFLHSRPRILPRSPALVIEDRSLPLPAFFRSVSSHETQLRPDAAVRALRLVGSDAVLVSAYDMVKDPDWRGIAADLDQCRAAGGMVLLDSGNYEAYRKDDQDWTADGLREAINRTPHDFAFCFDDLDPPSDLDGVVRRVVEAVERDSRHSRRPVLPIVHAPRDSRGAAQSEHLPDILFSITRELRPAVVAVPERELGEGLIARARAVHEIRRRLDELGFYQPLHLLGTGNPLTIAILAAVGADCFDGLEWCRTVVDHETGRLYHFQQYEFFAWQSGFAASPIVREAVANDQIEFPGKVTFHNLEFFRTWMEEVRDMVRNGKTDRFLTDKLPGGAKSLKHLEAAVPEVFG